MIKKKIKIFFFFLNMRVAKYPSTILRSVSDMRLEPSDPHQDFHKQI